MDVDAIATKLRGCELARQLEAELCRSGAPNTGFLNAMCWEISAVFMTAAEQLGQRELADILGGGVSEGGSLVAFERVAATPMVGMEVPMAIPVPEVLAGGPAAGMRPPRKRKEGEHTTTTRVPAPLRGNLDLPPDDGYTWRKYGQKDILNARFPRSYYRCTHKSFYGCNARKKVQRLDDNPFIYEVTYCGDHTCQTSTAPLLIPANPTAPPLPAQPLGTAWADVGGSSSSTAGPEGKNVDWPVTDIAGAMFAGGSSGLDAMFIVPTSTT